MRIVLGITGASGACYARRILDVAVRAREGTLPGLEAAADVSVHWVASANAAEVWRTELGEAMPEDFGPGTRRWSNDDFFAPFASGSNAPDAVIVAPCSMSTLARIAHGGGSGLIDRACEVALKERRRLVLLVREAPVSLVHLRNMTAATEAGAVILPATPAFYGRVRTLEDAVDTVVSRVFDLIGLPLPLCPRWNEEAYACP
ncbi:MAG: UbiX family flavin prenyltransferase [Deltaproteobacteria bacterium]|nr:MAG: UbiX family flavin prenyltransferase [Deltaproteobacteria bacterium]